jgi:predicted ATPase
LQAIVKASDSQLRNGLDLLVASGLIFQEGDPPAAKYLFKHALVQEAAYSTLLNKTRQLLHARIGKALESRFAERVKMEPELLAYHMNRQDYRLPRLVIGILGLAELRSVQLISKGLSG